MKIINRAGLTLVEVLLAMVLLATVAAGVMSALLSAAKLATPTPERYTALNLARQWMDPLHNAVAESPALNADLTPHGDQAVAAQTAVVYDGKTYDTFDQVQSVSIDGQGESYKRVRTRVRWQ